MGYCKATQGKQSVLQQLYRPSKRSATRILAACDVLYCDMVDAILEGRQATAGVLPYLATWEMEIVRDRMLDNDNVRLTATYDDQHRYWEYRASW